MTPLSRLVLTIAIYMIAFVVGGIIVTYFLSGLFIFLSFVVVVQNSSYIRYFVYKTNRLLDVIIFSFALYAKIHFGVTIAMSITIGGLLYSFIYVPYLRSVYAALEKQARIERNRKSF